MPAIDLRNVGGGRPGAIERRLAADRGGGSNLRRIGESKLPGGRHDKVPGRDDPAILGPDKLTHVFVENSGALKLIRPSHGCSAELGIKLSKGTLLEALHHVGAVVHGRSPGSRLARTGTCSGEATGGMSIRRPGRSRKGAVGSSAH